MNKNGTNGRAISRRSFLGVVGAAVGGAAVGGAAISGTGALTSAGAQTRPRAVRRSQPASLNLWGGVPASFGVGQLVSAFNSAFPGIRVTYTQFTNNPDGNTKLDAALSGGSAVDVYFNYGVPYFAPRIRDGLALSLLPYISSDPEIDNWVKAEAAQNFFTGSGKFYGLPTVFQPNFFFANEDLLRQQKVHIDNGWTIGDFVTAAGKLSHGSGTSRVYGTYTTPDLAGMKYGGNEWYSHSKGKLRANFDDPIFKQSWQLHKQLIDSGSALPWTEVLADDLTVYSQNSFLTQQFVLWPLASWATRYLNNPTSYPHSFKTTFLSYPKLSSGVSYNTGGYANYISINPHTQSKEAAWEFVRWYMTTGSKYLMAAGDVPAMPNVVNDNEAVRYILGPHSKQFFDVNAWKSVGLDRSVVAPPQTIAYGAAQINTLLTNETNLYLTGHLSIGQLVSQMESQANTILGV